jgi:hypothetical protein
MKMTRFPSGMKSIWPVIEGVAGDQGFGSPARNEPAKSLYSTAQFRPVGSRNNNSWLL